MLSTLILRDRLVVLDTNVVLDLFHFDDPLTRPLRDALEVGALRGAVTEATFAEWQCVLAYPVFKLPPLRQSALLAQYRALCAFQEQPSVAGVPRCRDPDDQKFLDLAAELAVPLVSKDRAVLKLKRRRGAAPIIFTPIEALTWLADGA